MPKVFLRQMLLIGMRNLHAQPNNLLRSNEFNYFIYLNMKFGYILIFMELFVI